MTTPTTQYLKLTDGTIAYDDTQGTGQTILCLPIMGDVRQSYRFAREEFVAAGYRVITADLRGHGESSAHWPDYTIASLGSDILALVNHLKLNNVILVGTSISGASAIWAAAEQPASFAKLIIVSPFMRNMPKGNIIIRGLTKLVMSTPRLWIPYYKSLYPTHKPADFKEYIEHLSKNLREPHRYAATAAMGSANHDETMLHYDGVRTPALLIMGSKDPDFKDPLQEAEIDATAIRAQKIIIEGGGHLLCAEFPKQFVQAIITFVQK